MGYIARLSPPRFLFHLFSRVLPVAREELSHWRHIAEQIPDPELREQALNSLSDKRFHADGGCVYAAVNPEFTKPLVKIIVALQTISDYLDNLCDRCSRYDAIDFRHLHNAMRDAVVPGAQTADYYLYRGSPDDGGYLQQLVQTCQEVARSLPGYPSVQEQVSWFVERYCELQEHKHIHPDDRNERLQAWAKPYLLQFPGIEWWEFAAATGSTLGMFALFLTATNEMTEDIVSDVSDAYFPWLCGLHILLDYLIDLDEDSQEGDFNFVQCYDNIRQGRTRLYYFTRQSLKLARAVPDGHPIHKFVVRGLLSMYLSDAKAASQSQVRRFRRMVWLAGPTTWMFYGACLVYRVVR